MIHVWFLLCHSAKKALRTNLQRWSLFSTVENSKESGAYPGQQHEEHEQHDDACGHDAADATNGKHAEHADHAVLHDAGLHAYGTLVAIAMQGTSIFWVVYMGLRAMHNARGLIIQSGARLMYRFWERFTKVWERC